MVLEATPRVMTFNHSQTGAKLSPNSVENGDDDGNEDGRGEGVVEGVVLRSDETHGQNA